MKLCVNMHVFVFDDYVYIAESAVRLHTFTKEWRTFLNTCAKFFEIIIVEERT